MKGNQLDTGQGKGKQSLSASGVWVSHRREAPRRIIAEGEAAPGLNDGEVISFIEEGPYMNWLGQVAVRAGIGPAAGFLNSEDIGLWLINPGEPPQLVARGGTRVDIGGGEMRELLPGLAVSFRLSSNGAFSGGEDGRPSPFNDHGQLSFVGQWQEEVGQTGSGVFLAADPTVKLDFDTWATVIHRLEGADALPLADPNGNGIPKHCRICAQRNTRRSWERRQGQASVMDFS